VAVVAVDPSLLASELPVVLGQLVRRLRAERGLSLAHGSVMGRLDREGPMSTSDLAALERVRPQSMAQTVSDLQADGMVSRRPDPDDGRKALLELTDSGRQALDTNRRLREGWLIEAIAERCSGAELQTLAAAVPLLRMLAES
jgi:DNA-binding MarR family transcriptional regulator